MGSLSTVKSPSAAYMPGKSLSGIVSSGDDFEKIEVEPPKVKPSRIFSANNLAPLNVGASPPLTAPRKHATLNSRSVAQIKDKQRGNTESLDDLAIDVRKSHKLQASRISTAIKQKSIDDGAIPMRSDPRKIIFPEAPQPPKSASSKTSTLLSAPLSLAAVSTTSSPNLPTIRPFSTKVEPKGVSALSTEVARQSSTLNKPSDPRKINAKGNEDTSDQFARRHKRRSSLPDMNDIPLLAFSRPIPAIDKTRSSTKMKSGSHIGASAATTTPNESAESKPPSRPPPPPPIRPPVRAPPKTFIPKRSTPKPSPLTSEDLTKSGQQPTPRTSSPLSKSGTTTTPKQSSPLTRSSKPDNISSERKNSSEG